MRTLLLTLVCLFTFAGSSLAQTGVPASWNLRIYQAGSATAASVTVTRSQASCNEVPPAPTNNINPRFWIFDDVVNTGRVCIYTDARFAALPDGNYEGTVEALNADGSLGETARVPFVRRRPNPPAVTTGLRIAS